MAASSGASAAGGAGGVNPIGIVFQVASFDLKRKAKKKRKEAQKLLRLNRRIRIAAKRRAFMQQFRAAQQQQLLAGTRAGGFESSAFQGQRASLTTQSKFNFGEAADVTRSNLQATRLVEDATSQEARADQFSEIGSAVGGI